MWRVMYLDWAHRGMWLAFEWEGTSYWKTRDEALKACRNCHHFGAHPVFEYDFTHEPASAW